MKEDNIVIFMTFGDLTEAHLIKGILDDNGIPCFLSDENTLSVYPLYNQGLGGIKLSVFERDLEIAARVIKEQQEETIIPEEQEDLNNSSDTTPVCPVCGSHNVAYGASVCRKYGWLTILVSIIYKYTRVAVRKRFHCFNCGNDFKRSEN